MHLVYTIRMSSLVSVLVLAFIATSDIDIRTAVAQVESPGNLVPQETTFSSEQIEFFESKVRPLLVENCFECHGTDPNSLEGSLSLASRRSILQGGDSGPAIDLETPDESLILSAVEYGDLFQMPPDGQISEEKIEILRKWITDGAAWPASDETHVVAADTFDLEARRQSHWCWQPVHRPEVPTVGDDWAIDPIDRFVLAKLQEHDLVPASPATRETWIRRATFDLTGLPPTAAEIDSFLNDKSNDSHEKVVDRLLASSHFGERWARHWMDLIRYAETCGHEFDYPIPNAWQYRDYLIRAFNEDVPYNDFLVEHIAGDLVSNPRRNPHNEINESVLGTGFWFLGEATHGPVDVKGDEAGHIDNQIDVMCKTFLGLTVACARCHDHKFDAISTEDYYALAGFLQSSRRQDVMLDPGRKIETALEQIKVIDSTAIGKIGELIKSIDPANEGYIEQIKPYLIASVLYMQTDRAWQHRGSSKIEGESIEGYQSTAGTVEIQKIDGFDQWSNSSQLWWKEANPHDRLSFDITAPVSAPYHVRLKLTIASDYGIVQPYINGEAIGDPIDCFSPDLSTSGLLDLGELKLNEGANKFEFEITGKNEAAISRFMFGIDFIEIGVDEDLFGGIEAIARLESICDSKKLQINTLKNWIQAIVDPLTAEIQHPLYIFRKAAESFVDLETEEGCDIFITSLEAIANHNREVLERREKDIVFAAAWQNSYQTFPGFGSWHSTGMAFEEPVGSGGANLADPDNSVWNFSRNENIPPFSGRYGKNVQGVLRSPTFVITKPFIHYYVTARRAKIRLIIDGFQLDTYNALLFEGMTIPVDTDGTWKWVVQGGDLKNHIGHRAYIEIIDDGAGYFGVQDVRFSDEANPQSAAPHLSFLPVDIDFDGELWRHSQVDSGINPLEFATSESSSVFHTRGLVNALGQSFQIYEFFNFMLRHRLFPMVDEETIRIAFDEPIAQMQAIADTIPAPVLAIGMTDGSPENEYIFIRGNHKNMGDEVRRRPLTAFELFGRWRDLELNGSGRKELAEDLIRPENPMVSRVMVNRIWHHLTGKGIVPAVDNFGVLGDKPTHPELLDYLASEFVDQGWSTKKLIRRIVLSQTYRMSSVSTEQANEADPNNELLHAFRVRRIEGEAIRDSMLAVSGELDSTLYGTPVPIHLTDFMQGRGRPGNSGPLDGNRRRSIYTEIRRNFLSPMMLAFDTPIPFNSMGRRNVSNVPAQSLIMLNDPLVLDQAEKWATRLIESVPDRQARLQTAFRAATGRLPTDVELAELSLFVDSQAALLGVAPDDIAASKAVWTDTCHVIFNLKEFIYLN